MKRYVGLVLALLLLGSIFPLRGPHTVAASQNETELVYQKLAEYYRSEISQSIQKDITPNRGIIENYVKYSLLANGLKPTSQEIANYTDALLSAFEEYVQKQVLSNEIYSKLASSGSFPNLTYTEFIDILAKYLPAIYQPYQEYEYHNCLMSAGIDLGGKGDKDLNYFTGVYVYPWPNSIEMSLVFSDEDDVFLSYDDNARAEIYGSLADIEHFFINFDNGFSKAPTNIKFPGSYYYVENYCKHDHNSMTIGYTQKIYVSDCGHSFAERPVSGWNYVVWTPKLEYANGVPEIYYVPSPNTLTVNGRTIKLTPIPVLIGTYEDADMKERQAHKTTRGIKIVNVTINDDSFDSAFKDGSRWDFPEFQDNGMTIIHPGEPINTRVYFLENGLLLLPVSVELKIPDLNYDGKDGQLLYNDSRFLDKKYLYMFNIGPANVYGIHTMYASVESRVELKLKFKDINATRDRDVKTKTFCVLSEPEIKQPTQSTPVLVGSINNPNKFTIRLFLGCEWTTAGDLVKEIKIGKKPAKFKYVTTNFLGEAYILVYPPKQDAPGKYDLTVKLFDGKEVTQHDAVKYSDESSRKNVDVVFIIDNSGSMSWNDPNGLRGEAVKMFIDQLDIGDAVSIISFEGSANVLVPMTVIDSKSTKEQLISQVRTWAGGGTSLSAGLNAGYQQLLNSPSGNPEKVAIMLTDGVGSYNNEAELYKQQGWPVYTVGLGDDINPQLLSKIATETGGIYLHADKPEDIMQIYNIIKGKVKRQQTLSSTSVQLFPGQSVLRGAYVDPTVSSTTFSVSWPGSDVNLTLISPDGTMITPETAQADANITYTKGDTYVIYEIKNPLPGEWKLNITAVDVPETGEEVTAMVLADTNLTIDLFTEKSTYKLEEPVRLVGVLTLNGEPVGGIVNATVIKPDGSVEYLQLLDDNKDGVYETYYVPKEAGTYTVTLQASGKVNGVPFTRQEAFSVQVSSEQSPVEFKASIDKFSISTVSGKTLSLDFTINSTVQDIVRIGLTSLSNGTNTIAANYTVSSEVLEMVPDENVPIHFDLTVPFDAEPGNYTGEIVIQGTSSMLTIPIELEVKPRLLHAPPGVSLYSSDVDVEGIEVYNISTTLLMNLTNGTVPAGEGILPLIVMATGNGNFSLRIHDPSLTGPIQTVQYDMEHSTWQWLPSGVGEIIVPLSIKGFGAKIIVLGNNITINGTLTVNTKPSGAGIYINGKKIGTTPVNLSLITGHYNITLKASGYKEQTLKVSLTPGETRSLNVTLTPLPARLNVTSIPPGAEVYLNNTLLGRAPIVMNVSPGKYTLRVSLQGYKEHIESINLNPNKTKTITVPLTPIPSSTTSTTSTLLNTPSTTPETAPFIEIAGIRLSKDQAIIYGGILILLLLAILALRRH